jgi:putative Holliday junction resolvase
MKLLAIDFGERRIGLATSDASGSLVTPRTVVERRRDDRAVEEIAAIARREEVETLVVGLPRGADGRESALAPRVRSFARKLERALPLPIVFFNEHLTSREARSRFPRSVPEDAAAAAVLLEDYLSESSR